MSTEDKFSKLEEEMTNEVVVSIYVTKEGEVLLASTGELSKQQEKTVTKMLISISSNSSILFKFFLFLETIFQKIENKINSFFKSIK